MDTRAYDAASRVIVSGRGGLDDGYVAQHLALQAATGLDPIQVRQNLYDANGRLALQKNVEYISPLASATGLGFTAVNYTYDAAGNVVSTVSADAIGNTLTDTAYTVQRAEGYRQAKTLSGTGAPGGVTTSIGGLFYDYDANGHLVHTGDGGQMIATEREHHFVNDVNGTVLYSYYDDLREPGRQVYAQRQLVVNGEVLGRYGMAADARFPIGVPGIPGSTVFSPQTDFSFGYQPINGRYPAGSPGTYAVLANDTLQGIAKGAYGDASLWYLIAEANGLSSSADLRAGQVLTIPTAVNGANNVETFRPYDPSRITSDSPAMMAMPQGQDDGCGAVGQVIMVVIAVVATIYTAGAAGAWFGAAEAAGAGGFAGGMAVLSGAGGFTAASIGAAVVGGAVGSIVSQGVGVAIGAQDEFSWTGVALSAIGAGVTAGLGAGGLAGAVEKATGNVVAGRIASAAVGSTLTQGIAVATGLQDKFSWRSVAASAVSAGVGQGLNSAMGYNPAVTGFDFGKSLVSGVASSVVGQVVRGGKVSATTLASDAFGNIVGDSLAWANSTNNPSSSRYENQMDRQSDAATKARLGNVIGDTLARGSVSDGAGQKADPLGEFIDQQVVAQYRRSMYSLSSGDDGSGFRADGGSGVRFPNNTSIRWSNQIDAGIANAANQQLAMQADVPPKTGMVKTDGGWWDPNGLASVGADGSPTAQVMLPPVNLITGGGVVGGGYQATRPAGVGGSPGYDPRTDMPYGAPGFQVPERPITTSPPPLMGESRSWSDILLGGLPLPARVVGSVLDTLVFKSPSDMLGSNLEAAGYTRPEGSAAHHIVPYGDQRAQNIRQQLGNWGIDLNAADNGVFLPQVPGSTAPGAYHPSLNSDAYHDQLRNDFLNVDSRQRALDTLNDIRGQLLNGTYPGSKTCPAQAMKLFDLRADYEKCCSFLFRRGPNASVWESGFFEGTPRGNAFPIPKGERGEERIDGPLPDFTRFDLAFPTFSERAIEALGDLLRLHGEFAAIEMDEPMRYFAYNATTIVGVLDEEKSQIKRFADGGVMRVERHVLLESVLSLPPIFKIPQTRRNTTYVNEHFVQEAQQHGLTGFRFDLLFER